MQKQEQLIQSVKNKGNSDSRINAILMYGSFTQGCGDKYSDVEFYLFIEDSDFPDFDTKKWIEEIHSVYNHFYNEHGTEVVIFTNLIRGEFHFLPAEKMSIIGSFVPAGYFPDVASMVVCDKQGRLQNAVQVLYGCRVTCGRKESKNIIDNLFNNILYGINVYKRGELARSLECLCNAHRYLLQAIRLIESSTDHLINPQKNLENEITEERYSAFICCTANIEAGNLFKAYTCLVDETAAITKELNTKYAIGDYSELSSKIKKYLLSDEE